MTPVAAWAAAGGAALAAWAPLYYATYAVRSQWLGESDWHGRMDQSAVALTFDDGPGADTERVLDVLARHSVRAAFFVVGRNVERYPAVMRRIVSDGHEIGNHSYAHPIYLYTTAARTRQELERTQQVITEVAGVTPALSRPPCGVRTPSYFACARALGLRTVQWSVTGYDWKRRSSRDIARSVLAGCTPGAIVLLHDADSAGLADRRPTVDALPAILSGLANRGLRVETLSHVLSADRIRRRESHV